MKITRSSYKDVFAIKVETERLTALFLPDYGGKFVSLRDARTGREFFDQDTAAVYKKLSYDGSYTEAECSAFDDMFPTIDECCCDRYPWKGTRMPDHGEVCGLKWQYGLEEDGLHLWVNSPRFGYRLDKWITGNKGAIRIDYCAQNNTQFDFDFIYGAHCMIAAEEDGRIELPWGDGEAATLVFDSARDGGYGRAIAWRGEERGLSITPGKSARTYKLFFDKRVPEGWCNYVYPDGSRLTMRYTAETLPYLGIWLNWGGFHDKYNVAFEPCSGSFDRPDIARMRAQCSTLYGYGTYEWQVTFDCAAPARP